VNGQTTWADLPMGLQVAAIVLAVVQLGLQIVALVSVLRTPEERLHTGKRWLWLVVVILGGLVGAVVYLAAGRRPSPAEDPVLSGTETGPAPDRGRQAADLLYGKPKEHKEEEDKGNRE